MPGLGSAVAVFTAAGGGARGGNAPADEFALLVISTVEMISRVDVNGFFVVGVNISGQGRIRGIKRRAGNNRGVRGDGEKECE